MGVFSDMIRGIITEELEKMAAETKATNPETPEVPEQTKAPETKPEETKPEETKPEETKQSEPDISSLLRKEIRAYMAQSLNGEETEQEMPTADDALKEILGFADK